MANKPILEVDINDAKFKRFAELFDKYHTALKAQPALWQKTAGAITTTAEGFTGMLAALLAQHEVMKKQTREYEKQRTLLQQIARTVKDIGRGTAAFAKDFEKATLGLLKWSTLTGVIGGLAGFGGAFGLERLGQDVAGARARALGTGGTFGGTQALRAQFGQYLDPQALQEAISETTQRGYSGFGVAGEVYRMGQQGMTTDQIALAILPRAVEIFRRNPTLVGMQTTGLDQFFSLGQLRELAALPAGEIEKRSQAAAANQGALGLTAREQEAWSDLTAKLASAGEKIETLFERKLVKLAPAIERLSDDVVDIASKFAERLGPALDGIAGWLERHFGVSPTAAPAKGQEGDTLSLVRQLENSGDTAVSPKGAVGRYQILPTTAQQYGFDPARLTDPNYNEQVARAILLDLQKRYSGNLAEELVAYNAGPGVADKFRAANDDMSILPKETRDYLRRAAKAIEPYSSAGTAQAATGETPSIYGAEPPSTAKHSTITIQNAAGGNVMNNATMAVQPGSQ